MNLAVKELDLVNFLINMSFQSYKSSKAKYELSSKRIGFSKFSDKFEVTAFKNPDNSVIIVLLNRNDFNMEYNLKINEEIFHDNLDSHAIVTFKVL